MVISASYFQMVHHKTKKVYYKEEKDECKMLKSEGILRDNKYYFNLLVD